MLQSTVPRPRVDNKRKLFSFSLDPRVFEQLEEMAKRTMVPKSRIVERALELLLEDPSKLQKPQD